MLRVWRGQKCILSAQLLSKGNSKGRFWGGQRPSKSDKKARNFVMGSKTSPDAVASGPRKQAAAERTKGGCLSRRSFGLVRQILDGTPGSVILRMTHRVVLP